MKHWIVLTVLAAGLATVTGCATKGGSAAAGAGGGAFGAAIGYELKAKHELKQLERDFERGKISEVEYEARKKQVKRGSLVY